MTWKKLYHGGDGCFGAAQGSSVRDYKGWLAFPIEDFAASTSSPAGPGSSVVMKEVFLFFDFTELSMQGSTFYIDELGMVPEYWVF